MIKVYLQAFTGGGQRNLFRIPKEYLTSDEQLFYIEVACNGMFGNGADGEPDPNRYFRLSRAHLVVPNLEARRLFWDFGFLVMPLENSLEDIGKISSSRYLYPNYEYI